MRLMLISEKLVLTLIKPKNNPEMLVANQSLNDLMMMAFEPLDYDNAAIGSEIRWMGKNPVMGFITSIEEYGWIEDDEKGVISHSYYIVVANCDGTTHEFDLNSLAIYYPTVMVRVPD